MQLDWEKCGKGDPHERSHHQHNVNEVGMKVGYSTASHFIAAFKKKFGTTPKKYVMSLNN